MGGRGKGEEGERRGEWEGVGRERAREEGEGSLIFRFDAKATMVVKLGGVM